jgi:hypothetical protein
MCFRWYFKSLVPAEFAAVGTKSAMAFFTPYVFSAMMNSLKDDNTIICRNK